MHQTSPGRVAAMAALLVAAEAAAFALAAPRVRPPLPKITAPVTFGTPEADRILEAMQVFPPDNPWNQDVSKMPVHPDSARMIASIGADRNLGYNLDMGFILVPPDQKRVPVKLLDYPNESDPGPYPVPDNAPIENWPLAVNEDEEALTKPGQTLEDLQRNGTGDRHIIVVDPVNGKLYEFWQSRKTDAGWQASNEATFDLETGALRPERWTSSDAAGLPIFPAVVRWWSTRCASPCAGPVAATCCPRHTGRAPASTSPSRAWASASGSRRASTPPATRSTPARSSRA